MNRLRVIVAEDMTMTAHTETTEAVPPTRPPMVKRALAAVPRLDQVRRAARQARHRAHDVVDEARYDIKRRPLWSVGAAALGGALFGALFALAAKAGWRRRENRLQ